jgi:hypothetical protein
VTITVPNFATVAKIAQKYQHTHYQPWHITDTETLNIGQTATQLLVEHYRQSIYYLKIG